jgi:hypothetical protein
LALVVLHARPAGAIASCAGESGWSPNTGEVVPKRATLVYWTDRDDDDTRKLAVTARIDGGEVKTTVTTLSAMPYRMLLVTIESDRSGKLAVDVDGDAAQFTIGKPQYGKVHATTSRFHHKIRHTTVREMFDGLLIDVDVPAVRAHVKLRRDAKADWAELDVPVTAIDGAHTLRIGELGCHDNYSPKLLENGVDLDVTLFLPDGSQVKLADLTHAALPQLPVDTIIRDKQ